MILVERKSGAVAEDSEIVNDEVIAQQAPDAEGNFLERNLLEHCRLESEGQLAIGVSCRSISLADSQLHHQEVRFARFFDAINLSNVRVVELREHLHLAAGHSEIRRGRYPAPVEP